jgi:hypothetical protein
MAANEDVKQRKIIENHARNISHNVWCTECGSQLIEDSQAIVAILLRKLLPFCLPLNIELPCVLVVIRLMVARLVLVIL